MQIYVCVKHVPDTAVNIRVVGGNAFDDSCKFVANPYDEYGVEEALQIMEREGKGEVVIVTLGKESAIATIRSALAMGADRGILIKTDGQFLDSTLTSQALKKAIEQDGTPDLIFTGKQSVDSEGMQTHFRLAAAFDMPVATDVVDLKIIDGKVIVEREIGGGSREAIEMSMPCVIGATRGLNEPRYAKLPDVMKAKRKEVKQIEIGDLVVDTSGPATKLVELKPVPERSHAKMLQGSTREMVDGLVRLLKEKEKVI
ncbi:MAG: electron transfer flavoprotein subunit beta/FixA family protein [Desulfobacteraceae bacterium]|nr:electron transfer flavoprotein subunit beta/FixA family protein [Desulfobacteraceae bacterium]